MPMYYHWYYKYRPIGTLYEKMLHSSDIYIMNEKATGNDWKKSSIKTLRHAAGKIDLTLLYYTVKFKNDHYNEKEIKKAFKLYKIVNIKLLTKVYVTFETEEETQRAYKDTIKMNNIIIQYLK